MPYPINQRAHQFNSIQSVPVSFGLWDTALKFLSPGPRSDVADHLVCMSVAVGPEAYNPSGWTNKFSIVLGMDSVMRNFRVFSCYHDFVTFIIFMYNNTEFPDNFKQ